MILKIEGKEKNLQNPDSSCPTWRPGLLQRWRILVVDDDASARLLCCRQLSRAGYTAEIAADGEQAWHALNYNHFDLVLTDHNMPCLSGLELAARIRAAGMTLPIIISSGCECSAEAEGYPDLDLAAVLHKSWTCSELVEAVKRILPLSQENTKEPPRNLPKATVQG